MSRNQQKTRDEEFAANLAQSIKAMDAMSVDIRSSVLAEIAKRYCECGGRQDDACIEEPVVPLEQRCRCVIWLDED